MHAERGLDYTYMRLIGLVQRFDLFWTEYQRIDVDKLGSTFV